MSRIKRYMEALEVKRQLALRIALDAQVLSQCEIHEYVIEGRADVQSAYRLGNARFSAGELADTFQNRKDMTQSIKTIVQEYQCAECPACAKNAEPD